eukprot:CAMPEP_0114494482 /NCGR_PEP_ID=MMETSP0109-20121206/4677_1 /TAXON_ID=29199 /ORGANISM="Chlorarachnion reptans, Strain CCCM449" /LENGTH=272 /DNA_ID=CAMNT_0001671525 /DNA_START=549 /DNA_END=1367 /DNA_ORIENTATION=+
MTAVLAGLLAGIALVFVRKERQRRHKKTTNVKKIKRASLAGMSRRPNRRIRNDRSSAFPVRSCCTVLYSTSLHFLDVCTNKTLHYLQGCPDIDYPGSLMENGMSSSEEEATQVLLMSPNGRTARQREKKDRVLRKKKKKKKKQKETQVRKSHDVLPNQSVGSEGEGRRKPDGKEEILDGGMVEEQSGIPLDVEPESNAESLEEETAILKRMGWDGCQEEAPLTDKEIADWRSKWVDWNGAKRSTIRKIVGLPNDAKLEEVIAKLVKLEVAMI